MNFKGASTTSRIAIVPARGGSKRVQRKNIRRFSGKPLLYWSIETALRSQLFEHVIVSTDDHEIATIAAQAGAETPFFRPAELSDDFASTTAVIQHALKELGMSAENQDEVLCLYPTAVLVTPEDIVQAHRLLDNSGSFVTSIVRYAHPIQRALTHNSVGRLYPLSPSDLSERTQDLSPHWHDAGQFYWGSARSWFSVMSPLVLSYGYELPNHRVQDIDTEEDWQLAEIKHCYIQKVMHPEHPSPGISQQTDG